jgi:hypothetical protein
LTPASEDTDSAAPIGLAAYATRFPAASLSGGIATERGSATDYRSGIAPQREPGVTQYRRPGIAPGHQPGKAPERRQATAADQGAGHQPRRDSGPGSAGPGRAAPASALLRLASRLPPLPVILAVQALLCLRLVWSNSAFNDEALYLWSGHWEIAHLLYGVHIPAFQTYFSGAPVIYPVIGAIADSYGGLITARLLSLVFMLGATTLCYLAGSRLFGRRAGLIGAAMFAALGPVQFLGSFATYDSMALFLLAASAYLVISARGRWSEPGLIAAAAVLALADATKYATGLWDLVVIGLAGLTACSGNWWRDVARAARLTGYLAVLILSALHFGGQSYTQGLLFTTLARQASTTPAMAILKESALWIGVLVLVGARSVVIADSRRTRLLCLLLTGAALLAPAEQARIHQGTSLQKHVAFGAWFAALAAGMVIDYALRRSKYAHWKLAAAAIAAVAVLGVIEAPVFHQTWPDSRPEVTAISRAAARSPGEILSEQGVVADYYLHLSPSQLINTFARFDYVRKIRQHDFSVIEIDGTYGRRTALDQSLVAAIRSVPGYHLVAQGPWRSSRGQGTYRVWRYAGRAR